MTINYADYEAMIHKLSYKFSLVSNFNYDSLVSEGNIVFCECVLSYNPDKSKFSTYLYICLSGRYKNMIRLQNQIEKRKVMSVETCIESNRATDYICKQENRLEAVLTKREGYNNLSSEAQHFIQLIINGPKEVLSELISPIKKLFSKKRIHKYLAKQFGVVKARAIQKEIKSFVELL